MLDNSVDFTLISVCKNMIKRYCDDNPTDSLTCLKVCRLLLLFFFLHYKNHSITCVTLEICSTNRQINRIAILILNVDLLY